MALIKRLLPPFECCLSPRASTNSLHCNLTSPQNALQLCGPRNAIRTACNSVTRRAPRPVDRHGHEYRRLRKSAHDKDVQLKGRSLTGSSGFEVLKFTPTVVVMATCFILCPFGYLFLFDALQSPAAASSGEQNLQHSSNGERARVWGRLRNHKPCLKEDSSNVGCPSLKGRSNNWTRLLWDDSLLEVIT